VELIGPHFMGKLKSFFVPSRGRGRLRSGAFLLLGLVAFAGLYRLIQRPADAERSRDGVPSRLHAASHDEPRASHTARSSLSLAPSRAATLPAAPAAVSGRVLDERGRAIAGARVCVSDPSAECCAAAVCAASDAQGAFRVPLGASAAPIVFASHPRHRPVTERVSAVSRAGGLVLTMKDGGGAITGRVLDAAGGPIAEAQLRATDSQLRLVALAVSDTDGSFRLDLAPGATEITARADGYSEERRAADAPHEGLEIRLAAASSITGRVLAEGTGAPVAAVRVTARLEDPMSSLERASDSLPDGTFRLSGLRSGRYSLGASAAHWRSEQHWLQLDIAQPSPSVDVVVSEAVQLSGVLELGGEPCAQGSVMLRGPVGSLAMPAPDGSVVLEGLTPGRYEVEATCQGARENEVLDIGTEDMTRVWDLDARQSVTGIAQTAQGAPIVGAQVNIATSGAGVVAYCTTGEQGQFTCSGVAEGDYDVELAGTPPRAGPVRVHVSSGSSPSVVLRAHAEGAIRVRVESPEGVNPTTFSLMARSSGMPSTQGQLSAGAFVFDPVPLGRYELFIDADPTGTVHHVELVRDGQVAELTLSLPQQHQLSGRVVDAAGHGLPDVWVRAAREQNMASALRTEPVLTDADGRFSILGLVPGRYALSASGALGEGHLQNVASDARQAVVRMESFGSLAGTLQAPDGSSVPSFVLAYDKSGGSGGETSGARGSWSLPWLPPGTYELNVQSDQGSALRTVQLPPGGEVQVALVLSPPD
jgi:hypothetical protein